MIGHREGQACHVKPLRLSTASARRFFPLSEVAFTCLTRMTVRFRLSQAQHGASNEHGETIQPCSPMTTKSVPVGGA